MRLGGVGRAARALHLAQPTVSTQLKELALALALGPVLLEPRGRGLVPTAVGERLALGVRAMGAAWQGFEEDAAALQGLRRGRLRIAAVTTTEYFLPDLLGPFARQCPGIDIELAVENRDAVVARLERGDDELAAMMLSPAHLPLARWPFLEYPLVIIAPADHALARRRRLKLTELTGEPLLAREAGSGMRAAAEKAFTARGIEWRPRMALGRRSRQALGACGPRAGGAVTPHAGARPGRRRPRRIAGGRLSSTAPVAPRVASGSGAVPAGADVARRLQGAPARQGTGHQPSLPASPLNGPVSSGVIQPT